MKRLVLLAAAVAMALLAYFPHSTAAQSLEGGVVQLVNTPHVWVMAGGTYHWAGDTRALSGKSVDWNKRTTASLDQLRGLPIGEPWLSAGLLKVGDPIFLVKWETDAPQPTLLHIQSIADVELFGINGGNYGALVLDQATWERRFGLAVASLARGLLAPAAPPPPPPCTVEPRHLISAFELSAIGLVRSGTVHNPCTVPIDVELNSIGYDRRGGQAILDVPSFFVEDIAPGASKPFRQVVRNGAGVPWFEGTYTWSEPRLRSGACYDVGADRCLASDPRLGGAIGVLDNLELGRLLLKSAALGNVRLVRATTNVGVLGTYSRAMNTVTIDSRLDSYSAWARAAVLAHELSHALQANSGNWPTTNAGCYLAEEAAFQAQSAVWAQLWTMKLPVEFSTVHAELNDVALTAARDPVGFGVVLARRYHDQCG